MPLSTNRSNILTITIFVFAIIIPFLIKETANHFLIYDSSKEVSYYLKIVYYKYIWFHSVELCLFVALLLVLRKRRNVLLLVSPLFILIYFLLFRFVIR